METPVVKTKKVLSPIWILPLLALIIGGWLLYKDYQESGFIITVKIKNASGLTAGKTKIFFKGLPIGTLKGFSIGHDLQHINARIEIVKEAREELTADSKIWIVRPEVSFNRITGLETIVTGSYLEIQPGTSEETAVSFTALSEAPPISKRAPGLHLSLSSTHDVSLQPGSPVYFKKIEVGEIVSNILQKDGSIQTSILIYPKYRDHVSAGSRFFISGGITLAANLPRVSLHLDPIKTIMRGGISFITPPHAIKGIDSEKVHPLYRDRQDAENADTFIIDLSFSVETSLANDAEIRYNGVKIGIIRDLKLADDVDTVHARAFIEKNRKHLFRDDTYLWAVKARITGGGISDLDTVISGPYLNLYPGKGKPATHLVVHDSRPVNILVKTGLNLVLETERLGSLGYDKPVYYRQVKVGHTTGYELSSTGQNVLIYINVHPPFVNLIRESTKFWNSSGIRIKGGLMSTMKVSTESLAAIIDGGISFSTPDEEMGKMVSSGHRFTLHVDPDDKWLNWSPALEIGNIPGQLMEK